MLPGFTTTADAYDCYIERTGIGEEIESELAGVDADDVADLQQRGERIRTLISDAEMPAELESAILEQYEKLAAQLDLSDPEVAVRSSATAEDLPDASFAGQQETFLNVSGGRNCSSRSNTASRRCLPTGRSSTARTTTSITSR